MGHFGTASKPLVRLAAVILCLCIWGTSQAEEGTDTVDLRRNLLASVRSHPRDYLSGAMGLHALSSVLQSQKVPTRYRDIVAMSGVLFKFVYDSTEAYEPLRDSCPFDLLRTAAMRNRFPDAHWETGLTLEEAKRTIKQEIDSGRPLISPFLKPDAYHGLNVITGYDYYQGTINVQGAFGRGRAITMPIPDGWDGPTVSPMGWAGNPVFVLGEQADDDSADLKAVYAEMVRDGIELLRGGRLEYGHHEGERRYIQAQGPQSAWYGLPAYEVLAADVGAGGLVSNRSGEPVLDFGLVWRIDAMVGLLEHDRMYGPQFVTLLGMCLLEGQPWIRHELANNFERTTGDARELRDIFWHEIPDSLDRPEDVLAYVGTSQAMVFRLPDRGGLADSLRGRGREVFETLWGNVLVEETPDRRLGAKLKVISILSRERETLGLLEQIAENIKEDAGMERPAGRLSGESDQD